METNKRWALQQLIECRVKILLAHNRNSSLGAGDTLTLASSKKVTIGFYCYFAWRAQQTTITSLQKICHKSTLMKCFKKTHKKNKKTSRTTQNNYNIVFRKSQETKTFSLYAQKSIYTKITIYWIIFPNWWP